MKSDRELLITTSLLFALCSLLFSSPVGNRTPISGSEDLRTIRCTTEPVE